MNPEIKKFWESQGKIIMDTHIYADGGTIYYYWIPEQTFVARTDDNVVAIRQKRFFNNEYKIYYRLDSHFYSEQEMLKRIKFKAFL